MTDGTGAITTVHFILIAVLAVIVVVGIVAGMRLKRGRVQAKREVESHAAEAGVEPEPAAEEEPVAPPPPPASPPIANRPAPDPSPAVEEPHQEHLRADEPVIAIAPDGTTAAVALDPTAVEEPTFADGPLTQIKGLGPRVAARFGELGIDRIGQLAALDPDAAAALDAQLGSFTGRMERDRWLEQARLLAAGDRVGFERTFGKL